MWHMHFGPFQKAIRHEWLTLFASLALHRKQPELGTDFKTKIFIRRPFTLCFSKAPEPVSRSLVLKTVVVVKPNILVKQFHFLSRSFLHYPSEQHRIPCSVGQFLGQFVSAHLRLVLFYFFCLSILKPFLNSLFCITFADCSMVII